MDENQILTFELNETKQFEMLFKERFSGLCNYANKLLLDRSSAEDALQQVFSKLWEKRSQITIDTSIKSYLYRATYNTCMNEIKRNQRLHSLESDDQVHDMQQADVRTRVNDLEKQVNLGLKQLPEKCRSIFVMSRYERMKYKEIAEMLEISIKTVENQMGKALKMMRVHLSEFISILLILLAGR